MMGTLSRNLPRNAKAFISPQKKAQRIYIYDMLTAYIMMAISIVLMITAFVVLRFTIGFSYYAILLFRSYFADSGE